MGDLDGRVAVVTGAGSGIGAAVARHLGNRGAFVVANDLEVEPYGRGPGTGDVDATVRAIETGGGRARADRTSVADAGAYSAMLHSVAAEGSLDILVSCAGIIGRDLLDGDEADWDLLVDTHVGGHLIGIAAVLPGMVDRGWGRILNFTSGAGHIRAGAAQSSYGTAKRAIATLTWTIGRQLPRGVTVNAVSPIAATNMTGSAGAGGTTRAAAPPLPGGAPSLDLDALPDPASLMPLVEHLTSVRSDWLSGRVLYTNGTEVSVISPPSVIEAVHHGSLGAGASTADALAALVVPAAGRGSAAGGGMPRHTPWQAS